ncbi:MAG: peroxidase-related enzyme [Acidimicrobiia bacterium]
MGYLADARRRWSPVTVSRYPISSLEELPDDLRERIEPIAERTGFVPNVFLAMGHRPDELRAFMDYHDALMERDSGLTKTEREMIVVATSAANDCVYCIVAHGAILRIRAKDPTLSERIVANWRTAPVTERQRSMLAFAVKMARAPETIDQDDRSMLADHGFSDEDIWDIGAIAALFALSNRMAHLAEMEPNPEFHSMGR